MTVLRGLAKAKINLSLEVLGRRGDGYHEIRSLVAFASCGDEVTLTLNEELTLTVGGPFSADLSGDNLIMQAARAVSAAAPAIRLGAFHLSKRLPVASGIGGGSADAAATLRLIMQANDGAVSEHELLTIAAGLGSDVPVCLRSRPAVMAGRGETLRAVQGFPACGIVLANPGVPLTAAAVYQALQAESLAPAGADSGGPLDFAGSFEALLDYVAARRNDLQPAAIALEPVIGDVLSELAALPGARLARMSGSGATCYALFATMPEAERAAQVLRQRAPNYWIAACTLD